MEIVKYNTRDFRPTSFKSFADRFFNDEFMDHSPLAFTPKVDVAETEKEFEIQLHLSGLKKNEIKIDLNEDSLTISGERKFEDRKDEKNYHSVESYYGAFNRTFHLPDTVDRDKVDALYVDGVLTMKLPKDEKKVSRKQIAIK